MTRKGASKSIGDAVQVCLGPEVGKSFRVLQYSKFIDRHGPDTTLSHATNIDNHFRSSR